MDTLIGFSSESRYERKSDDDGEERDSVLGKDDEAMACANASLPGSQITIAFSGKGSQDGIIPFDPSRDEVIRSTIVLRNATFFSKKSTKDCVLPLPSSLSV
eukprot:CCRYP_010392-RC/>CCRYP_010392-RC protein AED:0.22 eAED:0.26 QI:5616/0.75/0.66/1/0.12/0.11/9/0/101